MLVRIAALVAVDAPPASDLLNLGVASEMGIGAEDAQDVMMAIAPIVGIARVASATGNIVRALGLAIEVAELEEQETAIWAVCPGSTRGTFLREVTTRLLRSATSADPVFRPSP